MKHVSILGLSGGSSENQRLPGSHKPFCAGGYDELPHHRDLIDGGKPPILQAFHRPTVRPSLPSALGRHLSDTLSYAFPEGSPRTRLPGRPLALLATGTGKVARVKARPILSSAWGIAPRSVASSRPS